MGEIMSNNSAEEKRVECPSEGENRSPEEKRVECPTEGENRSPEEKRVECPTGGENRSLEESPVVDLKGKMIVYNKQGNDIDAHVMEQDSNEVEEICSCSDDDENCAIEMEQQEKVEATRETSSNNDTLIEAQNRIRRYARSSMPRLRWTPQLHRSFVEAVEKIGGHEKASPKQVLDVMKLKGLNMGHIKSHLQMYRTKKLHENGKVIPKIRKSPESLMPEVLRPRVPVSQPQLGIDNRALVAGKKSQEHDHLLQRPANNQLFNIGAENSRQLERPINQYDAARPTSHMWNNQEPAKGLINDISFGNNGMQQRQQAHIFDVRDAILAKSPIVHHQLPMGRPPFMTMENQGYQKMIYGNSQWPGSSFLPLPQPKHELLNLIDSIHAVKPSSGNGNMLYHHNYNDLSIMDSNLELQLETHLQLELGRKLADNFMTVEGEISASVKKVAMTSNEMKWPRNLQLSLGLNPGDCDVEGGVESAEENSTRE